VESLRCPFDSCCITPGWQFNTVSCIGTLSFYSNSILISLRPRFVLAGMACSAAQSAWIAAGPFRSQACLEMLFGLVWPGKKTGQVWPFRPLHGPEQSPTSHPLGRSRSLWRREVDARNREARRPRAPAGRSGGNGGAVRDDGDGDVDVTDSNPTSFSPVIPRSPLRPRLLFLL